MRAWVRFTVAAAIVFAGLPSLAFAQEGPKFATVTAKKAPIYATPQESSEVKATAKRGEYLEVGGIHGNWVKVRTEAGIVGFVMKPMVVPGKKELDGGAPPDEGGGGSRPPRGGGGGGPTVEGRTGLLMKAGLQFAGNSYGFKSSGGFSRSVGMKTGYTGINTDFEYWFIPMFGAHLRYANTFGSQACVLSAPINKKVVGIPTNIDRIEVDASGRFFLGDSPTAPNISARLGYHIHDMKIDPVVDSTGQPLYLVSNSYKGLVLGFAGDVPLGSPSFGVHANLDYWLGPSLSEGSTKGHSKPSGSPKSATGLDIGAGTYFNFSDTAGVDIGFEYASFTGSFSGTGRRFDTDVTNAKTTDSYILFGLNGTYRF